MSLFKSMNLSCPVCGTENSVQVAGSINADRRPDYRDAILDNTFQDTTCSKCGESFRNEPDFTYLDMGRDQWIAAFPARKMIDHLEQEAAAQAVFDGSFGSGGTPEARAIGETLAVRVTFGWPALREKLLARGADLDDIALECMKLDLIRRLDEVPMAPGIELRLVALDGDQMTLLWVNALTEDVLEEVGLSRALYDAIVADPEGWAALRDALTKGAFVDMQRLYMGSGEPAEAAE